MIGATYENGPIGAYFAVDSTNYQSYIPATATALGHGEDVDDSLTVTLGGTYDFEVAKIYLGAQYFDEVAIDSMGGVLSNVTYDVANTDGGVTGLDAGDLKVKGYSVLLGVDAPVAGGKVMGAVAYIDAEQSDWEEKNGLGEFDFTRWVVSAGYDYPLSKRTNVYAVASYMDDEIEGKGTNDGSWNPTAYPFILGMRHKF